jgi:hypothetical protein
VPKDLAHQLFWHVSASMRQAIVQRFTIDTAELDKIFADVLAEKQMRFLPSSAEAVDLGHRRSAGSGCQSQGR